MEADAMKRKILKSLLKNESTKNTKELIWIIVKILSFLVFFLPLLANQLRQKTPRLFYIVPEGKAMIVQRLGQFKRVCYKGIYMIIPFLEQPKKVLMKYAFHPIKNVPEPTLIVFEKIDLRPTMLDLPDQFVITKDNAQIQIDAYVFYKVVDPYKLVYGVGNFPIAIQSLSESIIRNIAGNLNLDSIFSSREEINSQLTKELNVVTLDWGVHVISGGIKEIKPDESIREAMNLPVIAERRKRAATQEGIAVALNLQAAFRALGDKEMASNYLATIKYIDAFSKVVSSKDGKVVFVPYEGTHLMSSLNFMKELFEIDKKS